MPDLLTPEDDHLQEIWKSLAPQTISQNGCLVSSEQIKDFVELHLASTRTANGWESLNVEERQNALNRAFPDGVKYLEVETAQSLDKDWILRVTFNDPLITSHDKSDESIEVVEYWSQDHDWSPLLVRAKRFFDRESADASSRDALVVDAFFAVHPNRSFF